MLVEGRISLTPVEETALENLSGVSSITRRDPGEMGPLIVETDEGMFLVEEELVTEIKNG